LLAEGVISDAEVDEMRDRIEAIVTEAVEFAEASPEPPLDTLYDNLYVVGDQVPGWYAVDERAPQPFAGEREREELSGEAKKLAEAGAAYGGQAASTGRRDQDPVSDRDEGEALEEEES
jgi:hypothetical protein